MTMGWYTDTATKWRHGTRTFAAQLRQERPDSLDASQALDVFSAGHYVFFSGSRESRAKKATDLLTALAPLPSHVLRSITAAQNPEKPRTIAAQKVMCALNEVIEGSDALIQMHAAGDNMRVALAKGSTDLLVEALQAWQFCLATAKCQASTPVLRKVQIHFLESALLYCSQHGTLLVELALEVQDLLLSDEDHLSTLSRITAQQLPTLALMLGDDITIEDRASLSRAVWDAVSHLTWERPEWFADKAVRAVCCKVRNRVCNAWVAAGGKLNDPGAPGVVTSEEVQAVKSSAILGAGPSSAPGSPRILEPETERPRPPKSAPAAEQAEVSQVVPTTTATEAVTYVQLSSHRLMPLAGGLAEHMNVPRELFGLVRLKRAKDNAAHLQHSMLFSGAPGCGKTSLARRLAADLDLPIYAFSGAELMSVYQGGPGLRVQNLFAQARDAAAQHPRGLILFIDEAGRLLNDRTTSGTGRDDEGATESFLYEVQDGDGRNANILLVCATNRPERIDPAVASRLLHFPLPSLDAAARAELFLRDLKGYEHNLTRADAVAFIEACPSLAGRDIAKLLIRAQLLAASRDEADDIAITAADLNEAWRSIEQGKTDL